MLVQKMAVNADLGFLLAVMAFLSAEQTNVQLEVRGRFILSSKCLVLTSEH